MQVLEQHDRQVFEVFALSTGPDDGSALRRRVVAAVEHFVELRGLQPRRTSRSACASLGIDILVDLKGATQDTLLPVFAARPAPLQVSWLGFPGTTGAAYIDYLIGDPVVTPLAHAAHFAEKIAQMPLCYQPNDARRERPRPSNRSDWGVPDDALLLCAFHQSYKISEEVFDVWCALLRERDDALLWLLQWNTNVQQTLRAAARARGIDPQRLLFAPLVPLQQHLDRLACADVYLDAWPCNAHTTAGEALWVGVPVVTLQGRAFAQRVASSLLHAVQLDELVCHDVDGYRNTVLALAADAPRRAALRQHLAEQQRQSLFDGAAFARDLEALLQRMWQQALRGAPPQHLAAAGSAMKAVILAGGLGTRLAEETSVRPKPMVEIGGKPILWHIMKTYSHHGINDFVICLRLQGLRHQGVLRQLLPAHVGRHLRHAPRTAWRSTTASAEPWRVTLVDTGEDTHDRRPAEARAPTTSTATSLLLHLRRRRRRRRHRRAGRVPQRSTGAVATVTAVQPAGPLRRAADVDGDRIAAVPGKAARRRRLDQRRLLRAVARSAST